MGSRRDAWFIDSHEAGHFLGNCHVDQFHDTLNPMDQGGNFPLWHGVGDDGIGVVSIGHQPHGRIGGASRSWRRKKNVTSRDDMMGGVTAGRPTHDPCGEKSRPGRLARRQRDDDPDGDGTGVPNLGDQPIREATSDLGL